MPTKRFTAIFYNKKDSFLFKMSKPKLLRVTTHDISLNGLLKGQLRFLSQYFEVVGVAADTGELQEVAKREGIRVIDVPMHREISLWADLSCLWTLWRLFRKERPDIVHANTPKGSLLSMIAAWMARIPIRIYTVTGLRYQGVTGKFRWLLQSMEKLTCRFATDVIPEGKGVLNALREDDITQKPLEVILNGNINGVDVSYFSVQECPINREQARRELNISPDDFTFVFVGRIVADKGMNELASCMKRLKGRCKLILVGSFESTLDPLKDNNEDFFKTSPDVRFVGWQTDIRPYLIAADALVFPSYREGFPNVVLQAGAMELPAIVTDINGANEIIVNEQNGIIIPPKDEEALYNAMVSFIEEPQRISSMASKAREMVCTRFSQQEVWNALHERYRKMLLNNK